jgi:hypothetical protein
MPCNHKFRSFLNLEHLDFEPTTLIVGTFVPEWPEGGNAGDWFYGKTSANYFWDVLPRLYGEASLTDATEANWKAFCRSKKIALTDLISCIEDAEPNNREHNKVLAGAADKAIVYNFDDFEFVNIVQLLRKNPSIKSIYLTRGMTEAFWRHLWNPVMHYCGQHNIYERKLLTPTAEASYQHEAYNTANAGKEIPALSDYILMRWQQEWHN